MTEISQELVEPFVIAAHGDTAKMIELLERNPEMLNVPWARFDETALAAASHTGNRSAAEYLLSAGAPLTMCAACTLGRTDDVRAYLENDRSNATARGAHGISVLFHAALSGDPAVADMLVEYGGGEGADDALHAAVISGRLEMVKWLLERGITDINVADFANKTPLAVAQARGLDEIAVVLQQHGGTA